MALLKANLSLSGAGLMTTPLNLTVSASINADSGSLIRGKVLGVAAGSDATVVYKASDKLDSATCTSGTWIESVSTSSTSTQIPQVMTLW